MIINISSKRNREKNEVRETRKKIYILYVYLRRKTAHVHVI